MSTVDREILSYDADIMCLQEVDEYDDWWAVELATAGYDSIYATSSAPDSDSVAKEIDEGLVTAFRKSTFQLFRSTEPWETSVMPSALCIVNTQLAAGPTADLERVRVLQAEYLCRRLAVFNADFQLPIVLAGTFNATPSSDVYHTIPDWPPETRCRSTSSSKSPCG
ncbi:hypothetical protein PRNP1_002704 [Phytophthora ramorum]